MRGRVGLGCRLALLAAVGAALPAAAQTQAAVPFVAEADLEAALAELEAGGVEVAATDLKLAEAEPAAAWRSDLALRAARAGAAAPDLQTRLRLDLEWVGARARWRGPAAGVTAVAGHLRLGRPGARLLLGQVGFAWGYGLLWAGPGRGSSLAASAPLAAWRSAGLGAAGTPDARTLDGGSVSLARGGWELDGLWGRPASGGAAPAGRSLLRLERRTGAWRWGALAASWSGQRGVSLAGARSGRPWGGGFELAVAVRDSAAPAVAGQGHLGWRGSGAWRAEILLTVAGAEAAPPSAARPALLTTWDGSGWAWRGAWAPGDGRRLALLLGRGRSRRAAPEPSRQCVDHLDLTGEAPLAPGVVLSGRWRVRRTVVTRWSERFPWAVPSRDDPALHTLQEAALAGRGGAATGRLLVRHLEEGGSGPHRERWLAVLGGTVGLGRSLTGRWSWSTAWGGDADLLSAVVTVRGLLLARHWGRWRSETLLGCDGHLGALEWSAAVSARVPEAGGPAAASPLRALWLSARWSW